MLKMHILLGKTLFMHANMDILLLVILLLSVTVIYSGKLERDIAKVCLTDSCFELQLHFWISMEHLRTSAFQLQWGEKTHLYFPVP